MFDLIKSSLCILGFYVRFERPRTTIINLTSYVISLSGGLLATQLFDVINGGYDYCKKNNSGFYNYIIKYFIRYNKMFYKDPDNLILMDSMGNFFGIDDDGVESNTSNKNNN